MWGAKRKTLDNGRKIHTTIESDSLPLSYGDVLHLWRQDTEFRIFFIQLLADAPFSAFRWETPPVTITSSKRHFEFVILNSPGLALEPDRTAFSEHFEAAKPAGVIEFPNLGGDAVLVVPCPSASQENYNHLAEFTRNAPMRQQHTLWESVGYAMQHRLGDRPVWLSTAGGGVAWLHVRLDDRPKYYCYEPYRNFVNPS